MFTVLGYNTVIDIVMKTDNMNCNSGYVASFIQKLILTYFFNLFLNEIFECNIVVNSNYENSMLKNSPAKHFIFK